MGPSSYDDISLIKPEEIIHVELDDGYMTEAEIAPDRKVIDIMS